MRCVVTAAVAKLETRNAIESTQNTAVRAASPSVRLGVGAPSSALADAWAVPCRNSSAWIGMVIAPSITARIVTARLQARRADRAASLGMMVVLAGHAPQV